MKLKSGNILQYSLLIITLMGINLHSIAQPVIPVPSQTDQITIDVGTPGLADPGDRIRYTVTIQNTGNAPATMVQLHAVLDSKTTLVAGSFKTSPLAFDDAYASIGNVGITVPAASGLLANDFDDNIPGLTATAGTFTTAQSGTIIIATDGGFTYNPPAGYEGADTYTYTLNDGNGVGGGVPATNTGVVTITMTGMIWFINNNAGACASSCNGRLSNPFTTLAAFQAVNNSTGNNPAIGDNIFIYESGTAYTGGVTLLNNQKLIGQDATATLLTITALSLPTFSNALPAMNSGNGTFTTINGSNAGGDAITLSSGNTVRGLMIGTATDFGIDDNGAVGTLTISEVSINNTSGGGFRTDNGGTLNVTLSSLTSIGGVNGINVTGTSGSFTVTGATNSTNTSGVGILLSGITGGTVTLAAVTVGNTGGNGIELNTNTATVSVSGLTTINALPAGTNKSMLISGGTGAITFANIDINGRRDNGITISGGNRNITTGTVDIDNPNSVSFRSVLEILSPTGGVISFGATTIDIENSIAKGIDIQNSAATVTFASGSTITRSAEDADFNINQGAGNVTYNGSITNNGGGGGAVSITSRTGGTVDLTGNISSGTFGSFGINVSSNTGGTIRFSGASKAISGNAGVRLLSNSGTTIEFTNGGLVIVSTTGTGFDATGGAAAVNVTGTGNTISSGTGAALNMVSTTIGANGLTFQSINTTTSSGSAGIILNNTGASGGLTISGTGTTGSGGSISNKTVDGISLINTKNVSLSWMIINLNNGNGLYGNDLTNFSLISSSVTNNDADNLGTNEAGLRFDNLLGTCFLTSSTVSGTKGDNIRMTPTSGILTNFTISGSTIGPNPVGTGGNGLALVSTGSGSNMITVTGSTVFTGNQASGFLTTITTGTTSTININNSTFQDNNINVDLGSSSTGVQTINVSNNTLLRAISNSINIVGDGVINGTINANTVGNGTADSGSRDAYDIAVSHRSNSAWTLAITNNICRNSDFEGIFLRTGDISGNTGSMKLTLTGNTVYPPDDNSGFPAFPRGIYLRSRQNTTLCANVANNEAQGNGSVGYHLHKSDASLFQLVNFSVNGVTTLTNNLNKTNAGAPTVDTIGEPFAGGCTIP
ncbi:MAG: Ig-like domain-containing protein [Saprospiraceae bacterium]